ncbi:MAG: nucleotidyltransferase family protein, partial [bacterium]
RGLPAYIRVLGHNARGREVLHAARKTAKLPLITKPAAAHGLPPAAKRSFLLDERAADLAALASPDPAFRTGGAGWRTGAVID